MRIINKTDFENKPIRKMVVRAHRIISRYEGKQWWWKNLRVYVEPRRTRWKGLQRISGRAHLHGGPITLRIPMHDGEIPIRHVAWVIYHELMHTFGYKHGKFVEAKDADLRDMTIGLPEFLPRKPVRAKAPKGDLVRQRAVRAQQMLATWQRRAKMAERKVREWGQRVRYYERKMPPRPVAAATSVQGSVGESAGEKGRSDTGLLGPAGGEAQDSHPASA